MSAEITEAWLKDQSACRAGVEWFLAQQETDGVKLIRQLMAVKKYDWANWLMVRILGPRQSLAYALFAAEVCGPKRPKDKCFQDAIEAAQRCLADDSAGNKVVAAAAAAAAHAAAYFTANEAFHFHCDVHGAAHAAAYAADAATHPYEAAHAATYAAHVAAAAAEADRDGAKEQVQVAILNRGLQLAQGAN